MNSKPVPIVLLLLSIGSAVMGCTVGGEQKPPHEGVFITDGRDLIELPQTEVVGVPHLSDLGEVPAISDPQPGITFWIPYAQMNYLVFYSVESRQELRYWAKPVSDGIYDLSPSESLDPGHYCYLHGDPLASFLPAWCFRVADGNADDTEPVAQVQMSSTGTASATPPPATKPSQTVTPSPSIAISPVPSYTLEPTWTQIPDERDWSYDEMEGLVAYYPMDGDGSDETLSGNDGIPDGVIPGMDRFNNPTGALEFDGSGGVVIPDVAQLDLSGEFTITCWISVSSFQQYWQTIFSKGPEPLESYGLFLRSNQRLHVVMNLDGSRVFWDSAQSVTNIGDWYHMTVKFDGERVYAYVNGDVVLVERVTGNMTTNDHNLEIGMRAQRTNFKGRMDELAIFDRALSDVEIRMIAND